MTANEPRLIIESDPTEPGSGSVTVTNLHPDVIASLSASPQGSRLLRCVLRVRVVGAAPGGEDLPDVYGRRQVLENGIEFIPHFPFDSGVCFRATFDPRPLTRVKQLFPTGDSLPENLLRFYACFSDPMQRGRSEEHISLIDADGRMVPDVLYRPPVELWDRSMRCLTILLDPGRLKRGVGPNRELGPPIKAGQEYTLVIGSGMVDACGRRLRQTFYKSFQVTKPVREPIAVERWKIVFPATNSRQPLALMFPKPYGHRCGAGFANAY
jgi:hypothetical protein